MNKIRLVEKLCCNYWRKFLVVYKPVGNYLSSDQRDLTFLMVRVTKSHNCIRHVLPLIKINTVSLRPRGHNFLFPKCVHNLYLHVNIVMYLDSRIGLFSFLHSEEIFARYESVL